MADLVALFEATRDGRQWKARCPAHDDRTPSLAISTGDDGRWLVHCRAGCDVRDVVAAKGLTMADLLAPDPTPRRLSREVAWYDYCDEMGTLLYQAVRLEPKGFRQRRPDGVGGWLWSLNGTRRVLYRLPELAGKDAAFVVEGERDVETLRAIGLPATTNPQGAGKWTDDYSAQLVAAGVRRICVIPDNDPAGAVHAQQVAASCTAAGLEVRILTLPDISPKGDVSEWFEQRGGTLSQLRELTRNAPLWTPNRTLTVVRAAQAPSRSAEAAAPRPLHSSAFYGLPGAFVHALEAHTESDPAALLVQLLVLMGSIIGRGPYFMAEGARHHANLFAVMVGGTSKGRKGSSLAQILRLAREADSTWKARSGSVSGEGLIFHVRDGRDDDVGVSDKRLCLIESEFASVLKVASREGSTLSGLLRQAWDSGDLETLAKQRPCVATDAHISMIGHITSTELRRLLSVTESANGFGNRFLWVHTQRSKLLPEGGDFVLDADMVDDWRDVVRHASPRGELRRTPQATARWKAAYARLSAGRPGMLGNVTSRAEAQTMRLALIYALCDRAGAIEDVHLEAAFAVWDYCYRSARHVFGESLGEPLADDLLTVLREAGSEGRAKTDLYIATGRNRSAFALKRALDVLVENGLARCEMEPGATRPIERWWATEHELHEVSPVAEGVTS